MSLSISAMGLKNVPVLNSDSTTALDQGVIHVPETSLPWSETPERNVYWQDTGWDDRGQEATLFSTG